MDRENSTNRIDIGQHMLRRTVTWNDAGATTVALAVDGEEIMTDSKEFRFQLRTRPDDIPVRGMSRKNAPVIQAVELHGATDLLSVTGMDQHQADDRWSDAFAIDGIECTHPDGRKERLQMEKIYCNVEKDARGIVTHRIEFSHVLISHAVSVTIALIYESFPDDPAIRKRIEVRNDSAVWVKLGNFTIDDVELTASYRNVEELTPSERGAESSIIAFGNRERTRGVMVCSEVPSALRNISDTGSTGYREEHFEWVLAPAEMFASEAVFMYGYAGPSHTTEAGVSWALDRVVESAFVPFLQRELGVSSAPVETLAPLWCTWSNFQTNIDDAIVREQAERAARSGFRTMILDMGWQKGGLGTDPDPAKFPNFLQTAGFIHSMGLQLGLWVSCYRDPDSRDMDAHPDAPSVPVLKRLNGLGMSFASPWRYFYADDLANLSKQYDVIYFKQDFTNIKFGDIAEGHESRTRKESLLRGLRGLLEAQQVMRTKAPGLVPEITHEIYWGTPGTPCDIAALRHAGMYHIPPNDYSGAGHRNQRYDDSWEFDSEQMREQLLQGCFNARQRVYAHRGLPLCSISYYGAATVNVRGSLTADVQDRQICSWLMGAPLIYAGDLSSLTEENIQHYRKRFDLLKRLQSDYGIYRCFQFSGVPGPTDSDWHWWGKLNNGKEGIVVVLRGNGGEMQRRIVIPWVDEASVYRVCAHMGEQELGTFTGERLRRGDLMLSLPVYGQEILELAAIKDIEQLA